MSKISEKLLTEKKDGKNTKDYVKKEVEGIK